MSPSSTVAFSYLYLQWTHPAFTLNPHAASDGSRRYRLAVLSGVDFEGAVRGVAKVVRSYELAGHTDCGAACFCERGEEKAQKPDFREYIGFDLYYRQGAGPEIARRFYFAKSEKDLVSRSTVERWAPRRGDFFDVSRLSTMMRAVCDVAKHPASKDAAQFVFVTACDQEYFLPVGSTDYVVNRDTGAFYYPRYPSVLKRSIAAAYESV